MKQRAICLAVLAAGVLAAAADYSWRKPHAKVLPTGDLQWAPEPFVYTAGPSVRYIDFEAGDDAADGESKDTAWKHHPWDAAAAGKAKACAGIHTYVFKRGVTYRGRLVAVESGTADEPIRLTSDPAWGEGEAVLSGAERVTGWKRGADEPAMPDAERVWFADLDFIPRAVWMVEESGAVVPLVLARTPNWKVSDPDDVMSEWWSWENPAWWQKENRTVRIGETLMHLGIDTRNLTRPPDYYEGAIVWTEWAIVMGTPFPVRVEAFDPQKKALAFQGRWFGDSGSIHTGNRYFLEDKPHYLDEAGEFWFRREGEGGRLYLRLPGDADPETVRVEAARRYNLIEDRASAASPDRIDWIGEARRAALDTGGVKHIVISGLSFRFNNPWRDPDFAPWMHKDVNSAAVRFLGSGDDVRIANCRFEQVTKAVRIEGINDRTAIGTVTVSDCDILNTADGAFSIGRGAGTIDEVRVLRNRLYMIGLRPFRQSDGHAITVEFPRMMEVAGNMLTRCYGSGIFVFGGKAIGEAGNAPLSRHLIHHNRADQTLLAANDWGGIETWQGGPFYVYNNISANPNGLWNWVAARKEKGAARLGFAYYMDGSFKNYLFNNIAWGANNDPDSRLCNRTAFYEACPTIHNVFFNNTVYRFAEGSNWSPAGGHHKFLGNVWSDISGTVFMHGKLKEDVKEYDREHPHEYLAYANNVFYRPGERFGVFEASGAAHEDMESFRTALVRRQALSARTGVVTSRQPLMDPARFDLRPAPGSAAMDSGVVCFVPWALYDTVGEWNFWPAGNDAAQIPDEHWNMADYHRDRHEYRNLPQYHLRGVNIAETDYFMGGLEDWIYGALRLNGRNQYAVLEHARCAAPLTYEVKQGGSRIRKTAEGAELKTVDVFQSNFLIEMYFRTEPGHAGGVLVRKQDQAGYQLAVNENGGVSFSVRCGSGVAADVASAARLNDGRWHHVIAECDRQAKTLVLYVDGNKDAAADGIGPDVSLNNPGDFYVGGTPEGSCLAGAVDFLRVARGTLADARTTIEELYAWQFDGPFLRDFTGIRPTGPRDAGAIEGRYDE